MPLFIGAAALFTLFAALVYIKRFEYVSPMHILSCVYVVMLILLKWLHDISIESSYGGRYARKIRAAIVCGFLLFVISEIMLFYGFFWAYFDRVFNAGYAIGCSWMPTGIEAIYASRWPLVGTVALITSGYFANHAYYLYRVGSLAHSSIFGSLTLLLAVSFLIIQCVEYNSLTFTMADSVYGSSFYVLTGFHGFHVTVGILFLAEQFSVFHQREESIFWFHPFWYILNIKLSPTPIANRHRHTGLGMGLIYWHFVDIVWIFLFINVYVFNTYNMWPDTFLPKERIYWYDENFY